MLLSEETFLLTGAPTDTAVGTFQAVVATQATLVGTLRGFALH